MFVLKYISALVLFNSYLSAADFNCDPCQCSTEDCLLFEADCTFEKIEIQLEEIPGNFTQKIDKLKISNQLLIKTLKGYVFKNANLTELQVLEITRSQLSDIHKNAFNSMTNLRHLDLSDNNISYIDNETMYWLKTLETLDLSENNIKNIPDLQSFTKLKELFLSLNKISFLNEQFLENTSSLENLALSHNKIETVSNKTFGKLTKLKYLHLSNNSLTDLPINIFENNTKLHILSLKNNSLVSLPNNLLQNTDISFIDLNNNQIRKIPDTFFYNQTGLIKISLSNNVIDNIPKASFNNLPALHLLHLSYNNIKMLYTDFVAHKYCNKFRPLFLEVKLDHNNITEVLSRLFGKTCSEISLDLSYNNISKIDSNAFIEADIVHLDLSHNALASLSKDTFTIGLNYLDLSYNKLIALPENIIKVIQSMFVNLDSNNLKYLSSNWFEVYLPIKFMIYLSVANNSITSFDVNSKVILNLNILGNKLNCDCNLKEQFNEYKSSTIECYTPMDLRGHKWNKLQLDQFACQPKILENITETSSDGATKSIGCKAYGSPMPQIRWVKNNVTLPDDATNIVKTTETESTDVYWYNLTFLNNTTRNFAGNYYCELSNNAGMAKMNFTVLVLQSSTVHVGTALWITAVVLILVGIHVVLVMSYFKRLRRNAAANNTDCNVPYENVEVNETQAMVV